MIGIQICPNLLAGTCDDHSSLQAQYIHSHLVEHLKHVRQFPALTGKLLDERVLITHGSEFLRVAKEFDLESVIVLLPRCTEAELPTWVLSKARLISLDVLDWEARQTWIRGNHTLFFELSGDLVMSVLADRFEQLYSKSIMPHIPSELDSRTFVQVDEQRKSMLLECATPVGDPEYGAKFRALLAALECGSARLLSFNGLPWKV